MKTKIRQVSLAFVLALLISSCLVAPVLAGAPPTENPKQGSAGLQGTVPTPPPDKAATIAVPRNGNTFNHNPIEVSGLCTTDLLVKVFSNNVFVGSALCVDGSYSVQIDLFDGRNDLVARIFDSLDQPGPDSNVVTVTYSNNQFGGTGIQPLRL